MLAAITGVLAVVVVIAVVALVIFAQLYKSGFFLNRRNRQ
jgi:hypothetical protein